MINEGKLTKEQAQKEMEKSVDKKQATKELKRLCRFAKTSYSLTMLKAKIYSKRWW
jgi:hypothetical protein